MRIRSIKPEFWTSEDIAALDWPTRLLFIGLWSYVDDNGVGRDNPKLIKADLFPLEDDPRETLATVSRGLQALCDGGQIDRYSVDGKPFLYVNAWPDHQRIDRPNKARYPLPTCENAEPRETIATPSRVSRETPATGAGEQGNRGAGEKDSCASADAEREFDDFWSTYPKKRSKGQAAKAFKAARRNASQEQILDGLRKHLGAWAGKDPQFIPYPASWLNAMGWLDEIDEQPLTGPSRLPHASQLETPPDGLSEEEYAEWIYRRRA